MLKPKIVSLGSLSNPDAAYCADSPPSLPHTALDEYVTLIDGRMQFRVSQASQTDSDKSGAVAFTWIDLAGEEEDSYLLVVEDQPKEKIAEFELTMYRCMWERDNNRDAKDARKEELMAYGSAKSDVATISS